MTRIAVGVHFRRHLGGPGHLEVEAGAVRLTNRRATRALVHRDPVLHLEHKRWEPPGTSRWLTLTDGETTAWATMSRRRAARVVAALVEHGFVVVGAEGAGSP